MLARRGWRRLDYTIVTKHSASDERGSILVETCLGIMAVFALAVPFASVINFVAESSRDLAEVHGVARTIIRTRALPPAGAVVVQCHASVTQAPASCPDTLRRGLYVTVSRETSVPSVFGVILRATARAVARVE